MSAVIAICAPPVGHELTHFPRVACGRPPAARTRMSDELRPPAAISENAMTLSRRRDGGETRARVKMLRRFIGGPPTLHDLSHSRPPVCSCARGMTRECSGIGSSATTRSVVGSCRRFTRIIRRASSRLGIGHPPHCTTCHAMPTNELRDIDRLMFAAGAHLGCAERA